MATPVERENVTRMNLEEFMGNEKNLKVVEMLQRSFYRTDIFIIGFGGKVLSLEKEGRHPRKGTQENINSNIYSLCVIIGQHARHWGYNREDTIPMLNMLILCR